MIFVFLKLVVYFFFQIAFIGWKKHRRYLEFGIWFSSSNFKICHNQLWFELSNCKNIKYSIVNLFLNIFKFYSVKKAKTRIFLVPNSLCVCVKNSRIFLHAFSPSIVSSRLHPWSRRRLAIVYLWHSFCCAREQLFNFLCLCLNALVRMFRFVFRSLRLSLKIERYKSLLRSTDFGIYVCRVFFNLWLRILPDVLSPHRCFVTYSLIHIRHPLMLFVQ